MPLNLIGFIIISVISFLLNKLLVPKPKGPKAEKFNAPTCEEGAAIPSFYGTVEIAPNCTWFGDVSKKKKDVYTQYRANMQLVYGWGRVNEIRDISFDNKSCRNHLINGRVIRIPPGVPYTVTDQPVIPGALADPGTGNPLRVHIQGDQKEALDDSPSMFGGRKGGGGPSGFADIYWGYDAQPVNPLLQLRLGDTKCSAYPKLFYTMFGTTDTPTFRHSWNNPTPYPVRYLARRTSWYESFPSPLGQSQAQMDAMGTEANLVEVAYDLMTNVLYGLSIDSSLVDIPSFSQCAASIRTEVINATKTGFGGSLIVGDTAEAADAIGNILEHIDAVVAADPLTGKLKMKLIRNDYTFANLLQVSTANAWNLKFGRSSWRETINEVRIKYRRLVENNDKRGWVDAQALAQDLGNRYATGGVRNVVIDMEYVHDPDVAALIAQRQLRKVAYPLARCTFSMNRQAYSVMPGDVLRLSWAPLGITDLVVRVLEVNYGTVDNPEMEIIGTEDIFNVTSTSYTAPPTSGWTESDPFLLTGYGYGYGYDYGGSGDEDTGE